MEKAQRLRAMGSLCRQQAAYHPAQSWKFLAEAEFWEHLAAAETLSLIKEGSTCRTGVLAEVSVRSISNDMRWVTIAAA